MRASCGGTFLPPRKRGSASATPATQRQRVMNIGASSSAWISTCAHARRMQVARDLGELEAVRGGQRQHDVVLGRRRLQLEVELAAEALAQRQAPGAVDAAAVGRMDDELHAAGLVEEALEHDRVLRRQAAERGVRRGEIFDQLLGGRLGDAELVDQPAHAPFAGRIAAAGARRSPRAGATPTADSSSLRPGASPSQNGMVGGCALRVLDPHRRRARRAGCGRTVLPSWKMSPARLSTAKSSFTRADDLVLRLEQHLVVGVVGDGAAGGQRGQPRAAPAAQHVVDRVVMDQRAAPAAPGGEAFGQHARRRRRNPRAPARDTARRGGSARTARPRSIRAPPTSATICCASTSSGCSRDREPVELAAARRCRAAPRIRPDRRATAGTAGPWACRRPRGRSGRRAAGSSRSSAASRAGRPDRRRRCRCRARARRSRPAPSARRASAAARRRAAAPWRGCRGARSTLLVAEPLGQLARHALGHAARVDEDQRGAVRLDQLRRAGRRPAPRPRPTSPLRAAPPAPRARGRARADGRCR